MPDASLKPPAEQAPEPAAGRWLPGRLAWPWVVALGLALALGIGLGSQEPTHPTPVSLPNAYRLLVGVELFFLLALVPLLAGSGVARPPVGLLSLVLLLATSAPAVVAAAWASDVDLASVAASQGYLLLAAAFVAGLARRGDASRRVYLVLLAVLGGGAPFLAFVLGDLFHLPLTWLYACSPFWVADRLCHPWHLDAHWLVPAAGLLTVTLALHVFPRRRPS
jgi:hypothetical protein